MSVSVCLPPLSVLVVKIAVSPQCLVLVLLVAFGSEWNALLLSSRLVLQYRVVLFSLCL